MNKKLLIIMAIAFTVLWLIPHDIPNYDGDTDFPWNYVPAAQGEHYDTFHGFAYIGILKVFHFLFDDWMLAGRMISSLSMVLSMWFIFKIASWPGVVLLAVSPVFWFCGYTLTPDALGWLLMVACYWFLLSASRYARFGLSGKAIARELILSGVACGLAFCTKYPLFVMLVMGIKIPWRKKWLFFAPALTLIGFQVFLNLINGTGPIGTNWHLNVIEKGTALDPGSILRNLIIIPLQTMNDFWPLMGIVVLMAFYQLFKDRRWELWIIGFGSFVPVVLSFYSPRFMLPLMLPVIVGGSIFYSQRMER